MDFQTPLLTIVIDKRGNIRFHPSSLNFWIARGESVDSPGGLGINKNVPSYVRVASGFVKE